MYDSFSGIAHDVVAAPVYLVAMINAANRLGVIVRNHPGREPCVH